MNRTFLSAACLRRAGGAAVVALALLGAPLQAGAERLVRTIPLPQLAPEDIALDTGDGSFWITSFLTPEIYHYDADWRLLGTIPSPFFEATPLTGIAFDEDQGTLLVVNPLTAEVVEIDRQGTPTGVWFRLDLDPVVNVRGIPMPRALAYVRATPSFDPLLLVFESVGAQIYGYTLNGVRVFAFVHIDDIDGYPGHGAGVGGGGLAPVYDTEGELAGVEFTGSQDGTYVVRQVALTPDLEARYDGRYIPLEGLSGQAAGFARGRDRDPATGERIDVFFSVVDTQHSVYVFRTDPLPLYAPFDLVCADDDGGVRLTWRNAEPYDEIIVARNGARRAALPGDADEFLDAGLAPGEYTYTVQGFRAALATGAPSCEAAAGPGRVLARRELTTFSAGDFTLGLDGLVWLTDPALSLVRCLDPESWFELRMAGLQIQSPDDKPPWPLRIACDREGGLTYVIDVRHLTLHVFDADFVPAGEATPLALKDDPDDPRYPGQLAFNPAGDGGKGSLLFVEEYQALIYEVARTGAILRTFRHPDWFREIPPAGSRYAPWTCGLALAPEAGCLDLAGGSAWDGWTRRILRVTLAGGAPTGWETPLAGVRLFTTPGEFSFLWLGTRLVGLAPYQYQGVVYEIEPAPDQPRPPTDLAWKAAETADDVALVFRNNGPYDRLEVARDAAVIAALHGDAAAFTDREAPAGMHAYTITAHTPSTPLRPLACRVRVGPGAAVRHRLLFPPRGVDCAALDPSGESFFVTSNVSKESRTIFRLDREGGFMEELPAPYDGAWQVGALAVSPHPSGRRITTIGWRSPEFIGQQPPILLTHQDAAGAILSGPLELALPVLPRSPYVLFPASMHWDRADGFWFLERNAEILWHIDAAGRILGRFPHPAPPPEQFVYGLATAFCPERGAFLLSSSLPGVARLTHMVESTLEGDLTGYAIPLDGLELSSIKAVLAADRTLYAFGLHAGMPSLITGKAFGAGPAVRGLAARLQDRLPVLTWEVEGAADRILVLRGGTQIAALPAEARAFTDEAPVVKARNVYIVRAAFGRDSGPHAAAAIFAPPPEASFIRGDANRSGKIDLADAVASLAYQFANAPPPPCLDAVDVDDDGRIRINDPIYLLRWLFAGGPPPPPPFPEAGSDPTEDQLTCWP